MTRIKYPDCLSLQFLDQDFVSTGTFLLSQEPIRVLDSRPSPAPVARKDSQPYAYLAKSWPPARQLTGRRPRAGEMRRVSLPPLPSPRHKQGAGGLRPSPSGSRNRCWDVTPIAWPSPTAPIGATRRPSLLRLVAPICSSQNPESTLPSCRLRNCRLNVPKPVAIHNPTKKFAPLFSITCKERPRIPKPATSNM